MPTLQMLTDKLLINYYFHMLLLQVKMCKLFKGGGLLILQTVICFFCCLIQNYIQGGAYVFGRFLKVGVASK